MPVGRLKRRSRGADAIFLKRRRFGAHGATVGSGAARLEPTYDPESRRTRACEVRFGYALLMRYRRYWRPGICVFLTLVTHARQQNLAPAANRDALRRALGHVRKTHAFTMLAHVVLPDHCHLIWRLPDDDGDVSTRVRLIKHHMGRQPTLPKPFWQARFWDHIIRDELDFARHLDYVHYNPVKHAHAKSPAEWADSSFAAWVERGVYPLDWGGHPESPALTLGE